LAQGQGDISTQLGIINGRKTLLAAFWLNFAQAIFDLYPQSQIRPSYLSNSVIWLRNLIKSAQRVRHGSVESMREIIDLTRQEAPVSNQ
jgi:hypothetical protein